VYRLSDQLALVATIDIFTPIVDDPYTFGQIAAVNSLNDIYAMGGRPLLALNFCGFPKDTLSLDTLRAILQGGADKCAEAGVCVGGGHTVDDAEPKYGLAVIGQIHPDRIITNAGAQPGDVLILTKPLGLGLITTAAKMDAAPAGSLAAAVEIMLRLNASASAAMQEVGVHAATDITGYGLLGHALEVAQASQVQLEFEAGRVPILEAALGLAAAGYAPGGLYANREFVEPALTVTGDVAEDRLAVLCDPQTAGGLLIAVAPDRAEALIAALERGGDMAAVIGRVTDGLPATIVVGP